MGLFGDSDKASRREGGSDKEIELPNLEPLDIEEDLHGGPLIKNPDGEVRIFGKFSEIEIRELMEWSGIFAELKEKGYSDPLLELHYLSDLDQRIFVKDPESDMVLIHIRLKVSYFRFRLHPGAPQKKLLYIDWLLTQHPRSKNIRPDRLFPGQNAPGLGIFSQISDFITNLALGVGARGAFNIPEYFHDALLFHREFRFYDPATEAFFRGLIRDLRRHGAREISRALSEGRVRDGNAEPVRWVPGEMISILDPELEEIIWSKDYFTRVVRQLKRIEFMIIPQEQMPPEEKSPGAE